MRSPSVFERRPGGARDRGRDAAAVGQVAVRGVDDRVGGLRQQVADDDLEDAATRVLPRARSRPDHDLAARVTGLHPQVGVAESRPGRRSRSPPGASLPPSTCCASSRSLRLGESRSARQRRPPETGQRRDQAPEQRTGPRQRRDVDPARRAARAGTRKTTDSDQVQDRVEGRLTEGEVLARVVEAQIRAEAPQQLLVARAGDRRDAGAPQLGELDRELPTAPPAPFNSTRCPAFSRASRSSCSADIPAAGTAAASSKLRRVGFGSSRASAATAYSACHPALSALRTPRPPGAKPPPPGLSPRPLRPRRTRARTAA